jgi:hypothetical protein
VERINLAQDRDKSLAFQHDGEPYGSVKRSLYLFVSVETGSVYRKQILTDILLKLFNFGVLPISSLSPFTTSCNSVPCEQLCRDSIA